MSCRSCTNRNRRMNRTATRVAATAVTDRGVRIAAVADRHRCGLRFRVASRFVFGVVVAVIIAVVVCSLLHRRGLPQFKLRAVLCYGRAHTHTECERQAHDPTCNVHCPWVLQSLGLCIESKREIRSTVRTHRAAKAGWVPRSNVQSIKRGNPRREDAIGVVDCRDQHEWTRKCRVLARE